MKRFELRPGVDWPGWQGGVIIAVCHYSEHSIIVRRDEQNSVPGDPRCVAHLVTDQSLTTREAYQSYYSLKPHQVHTIIDRCTPLSIGGES